MALPLIGALPKIIIGISTAVTFIYKFIKIVSGWFLLKFVSFGAIAWINFLILSLVFLYYGSVIKILVDVYCLLDQFIEFLNFKNSNSEVANLTRDMLGSALFFEALRDALNIFKPIISAIFIAVAYSVGTKGLLSLRTSLLSLVIAKI